MELNIRSDLKEVKEIIDILAEDLGFKQGIGTEVSITKQDKGFTVTIDCKKVKIAYGERVCLARALAIVIYHLNLKTEHFYLTEEAKFETCGVMADMSRNGVMKVESIKFLLRKMALMGLNMLMLYTEDTFKVPEYPYFGYMRGRYTNEELKECDDYAYCLGIEMVPCIQTLAHLNEAMKWECMRPITDIDDILLIGEPKTYEFIENIIKSISAPFRSKRIHIGMDEAHNVGRGKYIDKNGYKHKFDLLSEHLSKVCDITQKYGLKPMMWSDMFFRINSETGDYYDQNVCISNELKNKIPDVGLVYWDYYHDDEKTYQFMIKNHKKLSDNIIFAGGVYTWAGVCPNYSITYNTTNPALKTAKESGVKEVIATLWGDDGSETNILYGLPGMQLYAEHNYGEKIDLDIIKKNFKASTKLEYDAFIAFEGDSLLDKWSTFAISPMSKQILWQDILIGLFDKNLSYCDLSNYYEEKIKGLEKYRLCFANSEFNYMYEHMDALFKVLAVKWDLGIKLKKAYGERDKSTLESIASKMCDLKALVEKLRVCHRNEWMMLNKPFGWEVIDIRYGGVLSRIDSAVYRVEQYINGKLEKIDELEEERLFYANDDIIPEKTLHPINSYLKTATACKL